MRVLILTPYRYGAVPGPRSSIELWEKVLEPAGISFVYAPFETDELASVLYQPGHYATKLTRMLGAYRRRLHDLRRVEDFDAVLVYREAALIGPAWIERWVARRKPIIYQLDDPLYVPYRSPFSGYFSYLKFFGKVATICQRASVVIVNSPQHREYAAQYASNIYEVPSVVDGDLYFPRPHAATDGIVRVGWSGSASTVENLELIRDPLGEIAHEPGVGVMVIGAEGDPLSGVPCEVLPWRAETEVEDLNRLDVGLLPLPLNEWNKRKFFLKLAQYMALGIPSVATPLGAVPSVLKHGSTGYFAETPAEWSEYMLRLAADAALREEMGNRAAEVAAQKYTLQANAERIIEAFQSALK